MDEKGSSFRPAGSLDIATALEPYRGRFDERAAAHLLRRAGFGGTPDEIRRLAAGTMPAAVESLISFPATDPLPSAPDGLPDESPPATGTMLTTEMRTERRRESRDGIIASQQWWLDRMLATPAPLQEKMTLFWHGHFTSAAISFAAWR
jgi:uncharacterized protein (DUF1800 family)